MKISDDDDDDDDDKKYRPCTEGIYVTAVCQTLYKLYSVYPN